MYPEGPEMRIAASTASLLEGPARENEKPISIPGFNVTKVS